MLARHRDLAITPEQRFRFARPSQPGTGPASISIPASRSSSAW
jgi:hypothetical protein